MNSHMKTAGHSDRSLWKPPVLHFKTFHTRICYREKVWRVWGIWGSWKDAESHLPRAYLRRAGQSWRYCGWLQLVHGKCYFCLPAFVNKLEHANKGSLNTPTHCLTLNLSFLDVHTCAAALMHTYACTHTYIQMNVFKSVSRIPFHNYVFVLNFIAQNGEIAGLSHAPW